MSNEKIDGELFSYLEKKLTQAIQSYDLLGLEAVSLDAAKTVRDALFEFTSRLGKAPFIVGSNNISTMEYWRPSENEMVYLRDVVVLYAIDQIITQHCDYRPITGYAFFMQIVRKNSLDSLLVRVAAGFAHYDKYWVTLTDENI